MTDLHASELSAAELDQFHEQGYVRLGHVASREEIDGLCQRIDQIMLGEVSYDNMLMQLCPSAGNPELSRQTKEFKGLFAQVPQNSGSGAGSAVLGLHAKAALSAT